MSVYPFIELVFLIVAVEDYQSQLVDKTLDYIES
jgi:hypothetical protein